MFNESAPGDLRAAQRLLEVAPQLLDRLEPDAQAQQARRDAVALPAVAALHRRGDAAEARRVHDQRASGLDARAPRRRRRRRTRAARRSPGSGRSRRRMRRASAVARARSPSRSAAATRTLERLQARGASSQAGVGRGDDPGRAPRNSRSRSASVAASQTTAPSSTSWWPARYFVAEWSDDVAALLERPQVHRRRGGRVADDQAPGARLRASRSGIVRSGFEGASTQTRSAPGGRRAGLVELDVPEAPALELARRARRCRSTRPRRARSCSPGASEREHDRRRRAHPGGEEQRVAALELAERALGRDAGRVGVARSSRSAPGSPSSYGQIVERSSGRPSTRTTVVRSLAHG